MEPKPDSMAEESGKLSLGCEGEEVNSNKKTIGVLEVHINQARDIHNICIYHNQDVYAKIFLTDDPEQAASTQIVNGGGKNPVFNENLWVNVRTIECSLRCEVWMMSRIKNYMEDQLLGFALVPLCDVVVVAGNGKIMSGEFALSSCDLFHSPAGFVHLTARYIGALPPVLHKEVPTPGVADGGGGSGGGDGIFESVPCELEKIEFLDPKVMDENEMMVSEYLEISCLPKDVDSSGEDLSCLNMESLTPTHVSDVANVGGGGIPTSLPIPQATQPASETSRASKSPSKEDTSSPSNHNTIEAKGAEESTFATTPRITVSAVPEQRVVQQEIIDMYTKSMQQFTESLAKMKLPIDIEPETDTQNGKPDSKSGNTESSRVFYGSRAFF